MKTYADERYGAYVRTVPPTNWARGKPESERLDSWQAAWARPNSRLNDSEYQRPISFLTWLYQHDRDAWFDRVFPRSSAEPTEKFKNERRGIWACYGPDHGYIMVHPSEVRRVYVLLRILCGPMTDRSPRGGVEWRDVTLTDGSMQLRANTVAGREILRVVWNAIEGGAP